MARIITEPFKAGDSLWSYNPNGGGTVAAPLPPDATRYWVCSSGGNFGGLGSDIPVPNLTSHDGGLYVKPENVGVGNHVFVTFRNGSTVLCAIRISAATAKLLLVNGSETPIGNEGATALSSNNWRHVGWKYTFHASAGTIQVYLDNNLEVTFSGNTAFSQSSINVIAGVRCFNTVTGTTGMSSLYINDRTGSAPSNGFEGIVKMYQLLPVSDSAISEMLKSTGSAAFSLIDDVGPDLATYVYSNVDGQRQLVVPAAHGLSAPSFIRALTLRWIASKASNGRMVPIWRFNGGSILSGSVRELPVSAGLVVERRTTNELGNNIQLTDTLEVGATSVIP